MRNRNSHFSLEDSLEIKRLVAERDRKFPPLFKVITDRQMEDLVRSGLPVGKYISLSEFKRRGYEARRKEYLKKQEERNASKQRQGSVSENNGPTDLDSPGATGGREEDLADSGL